VRGSAVTSRRARAGRRAATRENQSLTKRRRERRDMSRSYDLQYASIRLPYAAKYSTALNTIATAQHYTSL